MSEHPLRFSVPDWCFFPEKADPYAYYAALKGLGIDAVEMVPRERHAAARAAGLAILNRSGPGMQNGLNNRANHSELIGSIRTAIREAAEDGISHVIVFSGNRVDGIDDGPQACAEAMEQLLPDAEAAGRILVFEMLNSFDHSGYEADNSAYGFDLAERFDSPYFKVLLDLYHMQRMGESPAERIRDHAGQIAHLHVAGSPKRDFPGNDQEIDYAACVRAAIETGYAGFWGMEFIPDGDPIEALRQAVAHFRSLAGGCP